MDELLSRLNLTALQTRLPQLLDDARVRQLSYEAFLRETLEAEVAARDARALKRRIRAAHLPTRTLLEHFDFAFQPTLSERLIQELASLQFVETATNVVLLGPPGVGKTHLASGLAMKAIEAGHSALFTTLAQFAEQMTAGSTAQTRRQTLRRYTQPRVLVVDEIGYTRLAPEAARLLFEVVTSRYERGPTILTSNLSFGDWGGLLGDEVLAGALLDRLLHHAEVLTINGRSYRMRERLQGDTGGEHKAAAPTG